MSARAPRALRLACVVALLGLPAPVAAWCQLTTDNTEARPGQCITEGEPLRWKRRCLSYTLDASGSPDLPIETVREVVREAFAEWTSVSCDGESLDFEVRETEVVAECRRAEHRSDGPNLNAITFLDDWPGAYPDEAYAVTSVWHRVDDGEILDADITVNDGLGPFTVCPEDGCEEGPDGVTPADLPNVMTHEAGHFFGLAHSQFGWAAMGPSSPRGETRKRTAWSDDVLGICTIYPPGSLPASCDFEPIGGQGTTCPKGGCSAGGERPVGFFAGLCALLAVLLGRRRT